MKLPPLRPDWERLVEMASIHDGIRVGEGVNLAMARFQSRYPVDNFFDFLTFVTDRFENTKSLMDELYALKEVEMRERTEELGGGPQGIDGWLVCTGIDMFLLWMEALLRKDAELIREIYLTMKDFGLKTQTHMGGETITYPPCPEAKQRTGSKSVARITITSAQAKRGIRVRVKTETGKKVMLNLQKNITNGTKLRIPSEGKNGSDQYVLVTVL